MAVARGRSSTLVMPAGVLAVAMLGVLALAGPGDSRIAVIILGVLGLALVVLLGRTQPDRGAGDFLLSIMLLGLAARFGILALIYRTVGPYVFAPDAGNYEQLGLRLARSWTGAGPRVMEPVVQGILPGYSHFTGALFFVFGEARAAPNMVNALVGVAIAVVVYRLSKLLMPSEEFIARAVTVLTVLFPSLMLWSVLTVREAPTILAILCVVYFLERLRVKLGMASLIGLGLALTVLVASRQYLMVIVGIAAGMGLLVGQSNRPFRSIVLGLAFVVGTVLVVQSTDVGGAIFEAPSLDLLERYRQDMAWGANSAYGEGYDVSTPAGALSFLPIGLVYFLMAPFPWAVDSFLQTLTLPEVLMWYALIPVGIWGLMLAVRHRVSRFSVLIMVLFAVTVSYALVEGNIGTAYRHRAQILPMVFVFCAIGMKDLYAIWKSGPSQRLAGQSLIDMDLRARRSGARRTSPSAR